jgi:hypothetical protein
MAVNPSGTPPTGTPPTRRETIFDVLIALIVLAALVLVFFIALNTYRSNITNASAVLGAIVPAISTVGAAAFGVAAGVRAGTQAGTVQAAAADQRADQTQQIAQRQQLAIASMAPMVSTLAQKVTEVSNAVHAAAASTPGNRLLSVGAPGGLPEQAVQIDPTDLETMRASAAEVQATINSIARS